MHLNFWLRLVVDRQPQIKHFGRDFVVCHQLRGVAGQIIVFKHQQPTGAHKSRADGVSQI